MMTAAGPLKIEGSGAIPLAAVAGAWGGAPPLSALDRLARALSGPLPDPGKTG